MTSDSKAGIHKAASQKKLKKSLKKKTNKEEGSKSKFKLKPKKVDKVKKK